MEKGLLLGLWLFFFWIVCQLAHATGLQQEDDGNTKCFPLRVAAEAMRALWDLNKGTVTMGAK